MAGTVAISILIFLAVAPGGILRWVGKHKPWYFKITFSFIRIVTLTLEIKLRQDK